MADMKVQCLEGVSEAFEDVERAESSPGEDE